MREKNLFSIKEGKKKIFVSLIEDLDLVPNIHVVIHNSLQLQFQGIQHFLLASSASAGIRQCMDYTCIHADKTLINKIF